VAILGLPAVASVGQAITVLVLVDDPGFSNPPVGLINWGDGTAYPLGLSEEGNSSTFFAYTTYSYGPASQGDAFDVFAFAYNQNNFAPRFLIGTGAAGPVAITFTGNITNDVFLLPQKSSFSSSSGNTKLPEILVNASNVPLEGPFFVVLNGLGHSVKLTNETATSDIYLPGKPLLVVPTGQLNPGQGIPFTLDFHSSTGHKISPTSFQAVVFAGVSWV
jgi:hypothetical protein